MKYKIWFHLFFSYSVRTVVNIEFTGNLMIFLKTSYWFSVKYTLLDSPLDSQINFKDKIKN